MNQPSESFAASVQPGGSVESKLNSGVTDSGLRKLLNEALFLSKFSGAVSATLDPGDVCAVAARVLYEHVPYRRITFSLLGNFGGKTVVFSPAEPADTHARVLLNVSGGGDAKGEKREKVRQGKPHFEGGANCLCYPFHLGDGSGQIEIFPEPRFIGRFSAQLSAGVTETFARAMKNALDFSKVKEIAMRDSLTGMLNRRAFDEVLADHRERGNMLPLSLLLIDIDDFKKVNDTFGHPAGDQVLVSFAGILQQACRGSDLAARYGGEEFVVILPATASARAHEIAQRLRNRFACTTFVFGERQLRLTASIGVSCAPDALGNMPDDLIRRADQALYQAKKTGKNRVLVYSANTVATAAQETGDQVGAPV
ncbi:MAG: hypothetical protein A2075_08765 [Geobacteraceae bacterium GWC2_58_44]|nr:MAG: hypothetical protein A2075_08765 [Geobacteraceae bacterium GWC2_58_44]HBG06086.1 GGDEF domain-containing protein [Geobacter sp.]